MTTDARIPSPQAGALNGTVVSPTSEPAKTKPKKMPFTWFDALFLLGGMVTYIADMGTDIVVGMQYFFTNDYWWAGLTLGFVVVSSITLQYFSFRWFVADAQTDEGNPQQPRRGILRKVCHWFYWLVAHILQLGTINRYILCLRYGWKARSRPDKYQNSMAYEWRDLTMLRLLEAFLESAPQLVLQVYIMTQMPQVFWLTAATAVVSLSSLAWSLEAYHKALRDSCSHKNKINYFGVACRIMWRTFTITARVIALALFASQYKWRVFAVIGGHWLLMTVWLVWQDTDFCTTRVEEVLFDCVMGAIHIFCFFNLKEGRTRYRALIFYTLMLAENTVLMAMWYIASGRDKTYGIPAVCFVWGGFFIGLFIMLMYYRFLHPNGGIRLCKRQQEDAEKSAAPQAHQNGTGQSTDMVDGYGTLGRGRGAFVVARALDIRDDKEGNLFTYKGRRFCYWDGDKCQESDLQLPNGSTNTWRKCRCPDVCRCPGKNMSHDIELSQIRVHQNGNQPLNQNGGHHVIHDKVHREGAEQV